MTDEPTPASPDSEPTTPLPASAPVADTPAPAAAPAAPAKSPWPWLLPVLVGAGALLLGGMIGGVSGFAIGHHFDRVSVSDFRGPNGSQGGDQRGPQNGPGNGGGAPSGGFERGGLATGTVSSTADGTISVNLENGDTMTYRVDASTQVVDVNTSSVDQLTTGDQVTVLAMPDGSGDPVAKLIRSGDALR